MKTLLMMLAVCAAAFGGLSASCEEFMTKLDPGEVQPRGWLRDWFETALDGYITHLDEYDAEFKRAWSVDYTPTGARLNWPHVKNPKTGIDEPGFWSAEGGAYWFGGVVPMSSQLEDASLLALAHRRLDPLIGKMHPKSVGFIWWLNRDIPSDVAQITEPKVGDRAWAFHACGIFARALCDYYRVTRDPKVLAAIECGLDNPVVLRCSTAAISSACEAHRLGAKRVGAALDAVIAAKNDARKYFDQGPKARNAKVPTPINRMWCWERSCHGVNFFESLIADVRLYEYTQDRHYLDAALEWINFADGFAMQPHGVPVTDEGLGLAGGSRGTETCDIFLSNYLRSELYIVTGENKWCDDVERGFFNAAAGCVSRDFKRHCYIQSPDMVTKDLPGDRLTYSSGAGATRCRMRPLHYPLCCTASLCRNLPGFLSSSWMRTPDDGLLAALWAPCEVKTSVRGKPVQLKVATDYPFGEKIAIAVKLAKSENKFPLSLRIPGWCKAPQLAVNGQAMSAKANRGLVTLDRVWRDGDKIELTFPMKPRIETGVDRNSPTPRDWACVVCGPLLFSLGIPEKDEDTNRELAFAYDYSLDPKSSLAAANVQHSPMPAKWTWGFDSPMRISLRAATGENLELIPYGCTRLRKTMFSVICGP